MSGPRAHIVVEAGSPRRILDLAELVRYRDLLHFLVRRQVLSRYKQTVLGLLWAIIQPVGTMIVFSVVLGGMVGVSSEGVPYPVFAYLGILPWQYFVGSISRTTGSFVANAPLIGQVYFPRVLLPLSASLAALVDFAVAFVVLLVIMACYGMLPALSTLLLVPLLLAMLIISVGIGMGLGALNVRYRDIGHALPFLFQMWMFLTPVVYPLELVPAGWKWLMALNPASGLVQAMRHAVLGRPLDGGSLAISLAMGLVLFFLGIRIYRRTERTFADLV